MKGLFLMLLLASGLFGFLSNSDKLVIKENKDAWCYVLIDTNHYYYSWDSGTNENAIYFIGNAYNDKQINSLIKKINSIYESEKEYRKARKKTKRNIIYDSGSLTKYIEKRLSAELSNRVKFDYFNEIERTKMKEIANMPLVKNYSYEGKGFILKKDTIDLKNYELVKFNF